MSLEPLPGVRREPADFVTVEEHHGVQFVILSDPDGTPWFMRPKFAAGIAAALVKAASEVRHSGEQARGDA